MKKAAPPKRRPTPAKAPPKRKKLAAPPKKKAAPPKKKAAKKVVARRPAVSAARRPGPAKKAGAQRRSAPAERRGKAAAKPAPARRPAPSVKPPKKAAGKKPLLRESARRSGPVSSRRPLSAPADRRSAPPSDPKPKKLTAKELRELKGRKSAPPPPSKKGKAISAPPPPPPPSKKGKAPPPPPPPSKKGKAVSAPPPPPPSKKGKAVSAPPPPPLSKKGKAPPPPPSGKGAPPKSDSVRPVGKAGKPTLGKAAPPFKGDKRDGRGRESVRPSAPPVRRPEPRSALREPPRVAAIPLPTIAPPKRLSMEERAAIIEKRLAEQTDDFRKRYNDSFLMSWIYHDAALEGVVYTYEELRGGLTGAAVPSGDSGLQPTYDDIRRTKEAVEYVRDLADKKRLPITVDVIRKLYLILHPEEGDIKTVKYRKDIPQHRLYFHEYAPPDKIAYKIRQIVDWLNDPETRKTRNLVRIAARVHYDLLRVYPFPTDSGKVARLFMNLMLTRGGMPPAIIHSTERQRYYEALKGSANTVLQMVQESVENSLASVEKLLDEHESRKRAFIS